MMPYEHLENVGDLEDKAYHALNNDDHDTAQMTMSHDEINVIRLALTMYKSVLMQVHKSRLNEELANTIKAFAEGLKKEDDDEQA